jgi:hypothetical protein
MFNLGNFLEIFSDLVGKGGYLEKYDKLYSFIHVEKTNRSIQIFIRELDKKTSVDFYEKAAKELPIYQEFMEFK